MGSASEMNDKKVAVALELIQGKSLAEVARRHRVSAEEATSWKHRFLEGGENFLRDEHPIIAIWKESLQKLLGIYDRHRTTGRPFAPLLFIFFLVVNVACYWFGVSTVYPELLRENSFFYVKIQFPVGILGALFDTLSFYITVYIVRGALRTRSPWRYVGHLSIDVLIALVATCWVVFVFWLSGWLIGLTESDSKTLTEQTQQYQEVIIGAVTEPTRSWRTLYFGFIMGFSAMIPTAIHLYMSLTAVLRHIKREAAGS